VKEFVYTKIIEMGTRKQERKSNPYIKVQSAEFKRKNFSHRFTQIRINYMKLSILIRPF
jgi:hypothetical protein